MTAGSVARISDVWTITCEVRTVTVTPSYGRVPDHRWTFTDRAGHHHGWHPSGGYPTLKEVVTETYWCGDCDDEHERTEWRCALCGEVIEPATVMGDGLLRTMPTHVVSTLVYDDGRERWEYPLVGNERPFPSTGIGPGAVEWCEDIAATHQGCLVVPAGMGCHHA